MTRVVFAQCSLEFVLMACLHVAHFSACWGCQTESQSTGLGRFALDPSPRSAATYPRSAARAQSSSSTVVAIPQEVHRAEADGRFQTRSDARFVDAGTNTQMTWSAPNGLRSSVNLGEWFAGHRLSPPSGFPADCATVDGIGVPPSQGLICVLEHADPLHLGDGRSLIVAGMYVALAGVLHEVLRVPIGTGPLYMEGCSMLPCSQRFDTRIIARPLDDGKRLELAEDAELPCLLNEESVRRLQQVSERFVREQRQLNALACASRGTYLWRNGRYERSRGTAPNHHNTSGP